MILGTVTAEHEGVIEVLLYDASQVLRSFEAIVDTGFNGWLSLPPAVISQLALVWRRRGRAWLADGSESIFDIYEGFIRWDGQDHRVPIDEADTTPLVGMSLLEGFELNMQVREGGDVRIARLEN